MSTEPNTDSARTQFGIFAKHWQPGTVKTRLGRDLGASLAAELYRKFVETLLLRFTEIADRKVLCYAPTNKLGEFRALPTAGWDLAPQADGELGTRIEHYFRAAFAAGAHRIVLIGSDSPDLPREYVSQAFELLRRYPVVLGPSTDGGYYLVGAAGSIPPIFADIAWSTPEVWGQTLERLCAAGLNFAELPPWYDVDERADLERLSRALAKAEHLDEPLRALANYVRDKISPG